METQTSYLKSSFFSLLTGATVASAFITFAIAHWSSYRQTGDWSLPIFCLSEAVTAFFLLFRRKPVTVSMQNFDWLIGVAGTFAPLMFRPSPWGLLPLAKATVVLGVCIQIAGLLSLNRSLAIVASKRQLKTKGMYRLVRHPIYCSYIIIFSSYLLVNTSVNNVLIYLVTLAMIFLRCHREEIHLQEDPVYIHYMQNVNYRLIPFIY